MYFKGLLLLLAICFLQPLQAQEFVEGVHYTVLKTPKTKQKEVREFFSFYNRNCYSQEPFMKELEKGMPRRAKFIKNHVEGMPNQNSEVEKLLTKALITSERMRIKDKVVAEIFKRIHINQQKFSTAEDIKALFLSFGVSEIMYESTANSFSLDIKYNEMKSKTSALRAQGHNLVPTLVINGKYKPNTTQITNMQQYKDLIYYLVSK